MTSNTRERLVDAMSDGIQRRGMNATGLTEVLRVADAPKGVLYHHFPGGKSALTVAAITESVARLTASLERAVSRDQDVFVSLEAWLLRSAELLRATGFVRGCPLGTVALESTPADAEIQSALDAGFQRLRDIIAEQLTRTGRPPQEAARMAFAIVAAYEGGLVQARVAGDIAPMVDSCRYLLRLMGGAR